ncbi:chymotrypsin-1-like isoform X2 [Pieris napi]|uniref:chymotrypsin-1-like isoform X2 n=1 Tax=Pieris napi TaxID=78633 RepID=UPI001FB8DF4F|nr:chymotrypsin-1-like isoform X2 [Pieris napi]
MFVQLGLVLLLSQGLFGESDFTDFDGDTRIIGGQDAREGFAIYQVSIRKQYKNKEFHWCGGSIIHEEWVLTAGYCTYGIGAKELPIVVGSTQLKSGGDRYNITKIIIHEEYSQERLKNNIALMKVDGKIKMKNNVMPIKLRKEPVAARTICALTGWGYIDNQGTMPNKLQILFFKSISNKNCNEQLKRSNFAPIDDKQLCVRGPDKKGACLGDSGGPLVAFDSNYGVVQVGIVSWGTFPCAQNYPEVFSSVSSYYDWIEKNMKD